MEKTSGRLSRSRLVWVAVIVIVGANMRAAITAVGPVLGSIRDDLGLSNLGAGLITSLPLLAFAATSPLVPALGRWVGNALGVSMGLSALLVGIIVRSIPTVPTLFVGTAVLGVGIAVLNVLLPVIIKERFPTRVGQMTGLYTTSMSALAAAASGVSEPLARGAGLGWELSLGSWAVLAAVGLVAWVVLGGVKDGGLPVTLRLRGAGVEPSIWRSALAWQVAVFLGLQSFYYYALVSWLPQMLQSVGFSPTAAGWLLSYLQFLSLPTMFVAPILAERLRNQSGILLVIGSLLTLGFTGMLVGGPPALIVVWVTVIGISSGATLSLSLTLLSMRTRTVQQAGQLSGMAQTLGNVLAASGPLFLGLLYDFTGTWRGPLLTLVVVCIVMTLSGIGAGRNRYVLDQTR